jgi:hypothetical protein
MPDTKFYTHTTYLSVDLIICRMPEMYSLYNAFTD